MGTNIGHV